MDKVEILLEQIVGSKYQTFFKKSNFIIIALKSEIKYTTMNVKYIILSNSQF